ncbi:hypothetical protein KAX06_04220 [candidate division WOR-3 bacterium]|nr:hypothetical protein [candidate division WOR-3 bacterium]
MKKVLGITLLVAVGAFVVFMTGCDGELPGEVRNLAAEAADEGASVKLTWTEPTDATGDETYSVYFDETLVEEEISVTEYKHFEPGKAGEYEVTVVTGNDESEGVKIDVYPIDVTPVTVWELNGTGKSGIGFDIEGEAVATYSMSATSDYRGKVDCYFSNFTGQSGGFDTPYYLASPDQVIVDPGDPDPSFTGWRVSGISNPVGGNIEDVKIAPGSGSYYNRSDQVVINETYAVSTQDDYYGLVQVISINEIDGQVETKVTFQPIQELRLF